MASTSTAITTLEGIDHPVLDDKSYRNQLKALQLELMYYQLCLYRRGQRVILLLEGPDAAGKGGSIRRFVRYLDPRGLRVHAIGPPNVSEQAEHYLQRFWARLPKKGQFAVFDRSWYGRVLVERVELGLTDWPRYCREINDFERMLIDDGIVLIKVLLHVDKDEQRRRLRARLENIHKAWKITEADLQSFGLHKQYVTAYNDMLAATSSPVPWHVVGANDKKHTRVAVLRTLIDCWREALGEPEAGILSTAFIDKAYRILDD